MSRLLALDLGTTCGWAFFAGGERLASGTWQLDKAGSGRFEAFFVHLLSFVQSHRIETIAHESVHRHFGVDAAHVFGGWLAIVDMVAGRTRARIVSVRPQGIHAAAAAHIDRRRAPKGASPAERRKLAEARRRRNKAAVIEAAHARGWQVENDNEADACFVGVAALKGGGR